MNQLVMERPASRTDRSRTARRTAQRPGATTAHRPTARAAAVTTTPAPHEVRTVVGVVAGVVLVLLLATWSFAQGWGRGPVAGPGEIALDGGIVRVDGVVSAAAPKHAMPGMGTDEDPVAEGFRRISVDVTLMAGTSPLEFSADGFGLTVGGEPADHLAHRDVLPGDVLPAGTRLSGTILFDVPVEATAATLTYDGAGATDLVVPTETEQAAGAAPAGETMTDAGHGTDAHTGDAATSAESGR